MYYGLSLLFDSDFDKALWSLPPPSSTRRLSSLNGERLEILYHFQYTPQSWREWQRLASIKIQIKRLLPDVEFGDECFIDEVQKVYTIAELGRYFPDFIKFHKPLYPSGKEDFMRSLTIYAQRLYYEKQLYYEAVIVMAIHFNTKGGYGYSFRELNAKAKAIMELDRDKWKVKLTDKELKEAHSKGGKKRVQQKREQFAKLKERALQMRKEGMTLKAISEALEVSLRTVHNWKLPKNSSTKTSSKTDHRDTKKR
ncbi:hypothetical protein MNB_SM-7-1334 [hydrothermal vent metagenome]|uniref:Uncharacterized protein n=1 Tax=hydrothermal vent metagenome TaxID=652676 RepID=A0A1W1BXV9_9ZZZZ